MEFLEKLPVEFLDNSRGYLWRIPECTPERTPRGIPVRAPVEFLVELRKKSGINFGGTSQEFPVELLRDFQTNSKKIPG